MTHHALSRANCYFDHAGCCSGGDLANSFSLSLCHFTAWACVQLQHQLDMFCNWTHWWCRLAHTPVECNNQNTMSVSLPTHKIAFRPPQAMLLFGKKETFQNVRNPVRGTRVYLWNTSIQQRTFWFIFLIGRQRGNIKVNTGDIIRFCFDETSHE